MSDFNPLDRAKIAVHRSSFDLSSKKLFSAKVGEILPVYWQIAIPGTKYRIKSDWFTRTVPVNTAAYTRIKEYYDFYAVPLRLISRSLPQAFTQMSDYATSAASNASNTTQYTSVPYTTTSAISDYLSNAAALLDDANIPYRYGACKLLDYLNYGSILDVNSLSKAIVTSSYTGISDLDDNLNPLLYKRSVAVNLLPLLSYQKIYFDFFSNSQWEKHQAFSYNVDYWDGKTAFTKQTMSATWMQLRYCNYPKDMFMGVLPASQYGSVAALPSSNSFYSSNSLYVPAGNTPFIVQSGTGASATIGVSASSTAPSGTAVSLNSDLSALSIRATEYLQRWKEVVQFSSKDYSDQMAAQFGIKAPEYMGNHAHYIGGWSSVININEVVNTNLDTDASQASIAGKGVGSNSGHEITYDCGAEHCVIMCVYHAVPMLDWASTGQHPQLMVTSISDFPQPAFDQLGMQPVPQLAMVNSKNMSGDGTGNLGYNLRYWQWKSDIDRVNGALRPQLAYQAWAAPLGGDNLLTRSGLWNYKSMKVFPFQMNSIFLPQVTTSSYSLAVDQLICNVNFQVYAVQNLDRNGLPY